MVGLNWLKKHCKAEEITRVEIGASSSGVAVVKRIKCGGQILEPKTVVFSAEFNEFVAASSRRLEFFISIN